MSVRLIAIDIDGTLLDSQGRLPDANRAAVEEAMARGLLVVLVTGRSFHFAKPVTAALPDAIVLIVNNGALVKTPAGATVARRPLAREIARRVIRHTRPHREGAALVFDREDEWPFVYERIDWQHPARRGYFERNRAYMSEVDPLEAALTDDPLQVGFTGSVGAMRALAGHLAASADRERISVSLTEYESRDFSLLDVMAAGCTKGAALAAWAARQGVAPADVMAVGDNLNDREMLAFAGWPVVMGNAPAALKRPGWPVTGTNDEAGLAAAIRAVALQDGRRPPR